MYSALREKKNQQQQKNPSSLCHCCKVTIHQDDCVIKNGCDLFCVTYYDVIGAAPFSVCHVPFSAFFLLPSILPFLIFCFWLAFVLGERPSFPLDRLFL